MMGVVLSERTGDASGEENIGQEIGQGYGICHLEGMPKLDM